MTRSLFMASSCHAYLTSQCCQRRVLSPTDDLSSSLTLHSLQRSYLPQSLLPAQLQFHMSSPQFRNGQSYGGAQTPLRKYFNFRTRPLDLLPPSTPFFFCTPSCKSPTHTFRRPSGECRGAEQNPSPCGGRDLNAAVNLSGHSGDDCPSLLLSSPSLNLHSLHIILRFPLTQPPGKDPRRRWQQLPAKPQSPEKTAVDKHSTQTLPWDQHPLAPHAQPSR